MKNVLALLLSVSLAAQVFAQVSTPAAVRMKSLEQKQAMKKNSPLNTLKFRNIGPSVMSGRVVDVDVNPKASTKFYVAYASGGVWYTDNNGQSFEPIFDSADVLTIGDIAVNWNTGTIWVGTGEVNSSRSSYAGVGVYKSKDHGKTWQYLGLPESHHIGKIQLHPTDDNIAWVAVLGHLYSPNKERGVYKTTDGGQTWKQTLAVDENTGAVDLDINPLNPNELYAAMWYRTRRAWNFEESGATSGIYKSTDGGENWTLMTKAGSGFPTGNIVGRIGLAVYPKNPQIVYAVVDNQQIKPDTAKKDTLVYALEDLKNLTKEQFSHLEESKLDTLLKRRRLLGRYTAAQIKEMVATGQIKSTALYDYLYVNTGFEGSPVGAEVYRSNNGGQTWTKTHDKELPMFSTYGYYFAKIYISPVNENKIVTFGVPVRLSTDGGKTWKAMDKANVHADHHAFWIDPADDNHMIDGNDGGINITYDNGENWFKANTPAVGQYYSVTVDNAKPYNVYGGLQDNGVWWGPSTNRENARWYGSGDYPFKSIFGGDGMQVQVDTRDNMTTYTGSQFGNYARLNRTNPRATSKNITPRHQMGEKPYRYNWQAPVLLSAHNQDVVYFGAHKLFRSFNQADTLVAISGDLTKGGLEGDVPFGTLTTISESPLRFGLIYVGTDDGNVQVTKDAGATWQLLNPTPAKNAKSKTKTASTQLPTQLWVSRMVASRHSEPRVYATFNGYRNDDFGAYVFVSEDYGQTWKQLGSDLPAEPVNAIREDPKNDSILYVGTDGGLYVSFNRGQSFMSWNAGMPRAVPIHDIAIQERENEIVLGTHGRSIFIAGLDDVQKLQKDPNWLNKKPKEAKGRDRNDDDDFEAEEGEEMD
ncbi:MAG: WD40/YVTN/BNR-like repeat-containing protein [Flavisolibacter sp.]